MRFIDYLTSPTYWLRHAAMAVQKAITESFACHDLSQAQYEVLNCLWREDGLEQRVLQERMRISGATLTGVIDGLVERGLVERRASPDDARVKCVFLSKGGQDLQSDLGERTQKIQDQMLAGFSPAEAALLTEMLKRLADNMKVAPKRDD